MRPGLVSRLRPTASRHKAAIATASAGVTAAAAVLAFGTVSSAATGSDAASAQGTVTRGSTVCAGPVNVHPDTGSFLAANGFAFNRNNPGGIAIDWTVRRGDVITSQGGTSFFTAATVIRSEHTARFQVTVPAGDANLPGSIWICGTSSQGQSIFVDMSLNTVGA
ncbi:hypothetical protein [Actinomadura decatromicini]|uniref:Uncharacterized protein n=1 Tax=Actinomadura decatromicini TaxID=2604572 RepID=A0A5D3F6C3_9ACTN|nr:hypothetical protein [Actinomadura decatromicini]TYK43478.1 hypothetical protein FXF68_38370 [Actinomadura decatromicini]